MIKNIPNFITMLNLCCGILSVIFSIEGYPELAGLSIFVAAFFDFLDGFFARLLKATSEIGKHLDSLADLVSFGIAPAFIAYFMMKTALSVSPSESPENIKIIEYLYLASPFLIVIFSAIRLARFNVSDTGKDHFRGLPTPANAIFYASFPILIWTYQGNWFGMSYFMMHTQQILLVVILLFSFLMVSNLPMLSLKFKTYSINKNLYRYMFLAVFCVLIILITWRAIPSIIIFYILFSVAVWLTKLLGKKAV